MRSWTHLFAALTATAILLLSSAAAQAGSQRSQEMEPAGTGEERHPDHVDYSDQIVWRPSAPTVALFLPQEVLDSAPLEELPIGPLDIRTIRESMERATELRHRHGPERCLHEPNRREPSPKSTPTTTIKEFISSQSTAFVGRVIDTVQGWSTREGGEPATLVYIRIDEILRDRHNILRLDQTRAYLEKNASIEIGGVELCSRLHEEAHAAKVGERVVFTGAPYTRDSELFMDSAGYVFPVKERKVIPLQRKPQFREAEPADLEMLRRAIRKGTSHENARIGRASASRGCTGLDSGRACPEVTSRGV